MDISILQILRNKYGEILNIGDLDEHSYQFKDVYVLIKNGKITIFSNENSEILFKVNSNLTSFVFDQVMFSESWCQFQEELRYITVENISEYEEKYKYSYSIMTTLGLLKGSDNTQW